MAKSTSQDSPDTEKTAHLVARSSLVITAPEDLRGVQFGVGGESTTIGRTGDLVVEAEGVSRRHARIWPSHGAVWIEDCGSTNGTLVNGTRISEPVTLRAGDVVAMGSVRARFEDASAHTKDVSESAGASAIPPVARHTETTRYLCAATHLDKEFCDHVLDTLVDGPFRETAPAYGVDLPAVASHALARRQRELIRDLGLLASLLLFLGVLAGRLLSPTARQALQELDAEDARVLLHAVWPAALPVIAALLIVAAEAWYARVRVLPKFSFDRFEPSVVRARVGSPIQRRLELIAESQAGNVVVFGGPNPFVGSGLPVESWSFAIDVNKGRRDPQTGQRDPSRPFDAQALHTHMADELRGLGLPGLRVGDRLFVDALDAVFDPRLGYPFEPLTRVDQSVIGQSLRDLQGVARTYLCLEATGWGGHLVVTMFFRAVRLPGSLFIEGASFVLLPLRDRYYRVDHEIVTVQAQSALELAISALGTVLRRVVPLFLASPARAGAAARRELAARRREGQFFGGGAVTSIREEASVGEHNRYFLALDHEMYVKVAQERLLKSIGDFLRDHGVDTEEFSAQKTIINQNRTVTVTAASGSQVAVAGGDQSGVQQQARVGTKSNGGR